MLYETNNLDTESPLVCEGIIGDGCGGGRIFIVEDTTLKAYDPQTQETMLLLDNIELPKKISKKTCVIYIECENKTIEFDLSSMKVK